jgi:hypothetical protein
MLVEPDISPLAKRLAEENNVNWRGLLGSGAGGKIVERDVLEYLAKVMAGEEDINPTAEPLPEGLDAWPEDDVRAFYGGAVPATETPVGEEDLYLDTPDLGSLELDAPAVSTHTSTTHSPENRLQESANHADTDLGEDIFLIDEAEDTEPVTMTQSVMPSAESSFDFEADSEVATFDDISSFDEVETEVLAAIEDSSEDLFTADDDVENLASLFVDDITADDSATGVLAQTADTVSTETDTMMVDAITAEPSAYEASFEAPAEPEFEVPTFSASETLPHEDVVEAFSPETTDIDVVTFEADTLAESISEDTFATLDNDEVEMVEAVQAESDSVAEPQFSEPELLEEISDDQSEPSFNDVIPAVGGALAGAGIAAAMTSAPEPEMPRVTPSAPVVSSNLPLVSYGVLLRRHVDLSTLMQAQHAVAEEITQEEPVAVTSFLLRAAAKAQHKVSLVSGQTIGLAVIRDQGVSVVAVNEASSAPFRQVLSHTQQALSAHKTDSVALVVADMSGFDIDEAVLNVGAPVLTLGRTMYDSSKGTHHSTLSLSGNVSVESGTKFLSAVAELLNAPVRLVV